MAIFSFECCFLKRIGKGDHYDSTRIHYTPHCTSTREQGTANGIPPSTDWLGHHHRRRRSALLTQARKPQAIPHTYWYFGSSWIGQGDNRWWADQASCLRPSNGWTKLPPVMGWRNYPVHPPCSLLDRVLLSLDGVRYITFASTIFLLERGQFLISGHSFLLTKLCYLAGQYSFVPKKMLAQQFKFCYLASCAWSTLRRRLEKNALYEF
jgi:hypothetical protein